MIDREGVQRLRRPVVERWYHSRSGPVMTGPIRDFTPCQYRVTFMEKSSATAECVSAPTLM